MIGISIKSAIGIGDGLQYSSIPENYFRATGSKLVDVSKPWFFNHNPFVVRDPKEPPRKTQEMWNFNPSQYPWPQPPNRIPVYLSNAEIWAMVWGVPVRLNRPRLYCFEDIISFESRQMILLHTDGQSHGEMPKWVIDHILKKYLPTKKLFHIGHDKRDLGIPKLETPTLWDLTYLIAQSRMLIGMDSGPSWIAACYPDVIVKKIRTTPTADVFKNWVPLAVNNIHAHWDDRCHQIFNTTEEDIGFTSSYRKI